jgi:hypothetical protein
MEKTREEYIESTKDMTNEDIIHFMRSMVGRERNKYANVGETIKLGYMEMRDRRWKNFNYKEDPLDPNEIVISKNIISIRYSYRFYMPFYESYISSTNNGFTRKEISKIIMKKYYQIYKEEKKARKMNETSIYKFEGTLKYLILHSLVDNGEFYDIGIDS